MAKSTAKTNAAPAADETSTLHFGDMVFDRATFDMVVAGSETEQGYSLVAVEGANKLAELGLAVLGTEVSEDGLVAAKLTELGQEAQNFYAANPSEGPQAAAGTTKKKRNRSPIATPSQDQFTIAEDDIPIPASRRGGLGGETYPFGKLAVGKSFHVPATADTVEVLLSRVNSSVSTANTRYAETKHPLDGALGAKFINRRVEDGSDPVGLGIRVWRTA